MRRPGGDDGVADILWLIQLAGGMFSLVLTVATVIGALYTRARQAPRWVRKMTGLNSVEEKVDQLLDDHELSQELQLQQAQAFNELKETVCEQHDIPESEYPSGMDTDTIKGELLDDDSPNFTRGGD